MDRGKKIIQMINLKQFIKERDHKIGKIIKGHFNIDKNSQFDTNLTQ